MAESGAIVEYLVDKYDDGRLLPEEGTPARLAYTYWLHYAEGTFAPLMLLSIVLSRMEQAPILVRPIAKAIAGKIRQGYLGPNISRNLDFMEAALTRDPWFCGDKLTAADIQMSFALEAAEVRTNLSAEYPHCAAFLERARGRAAYKAALDRGGHYELIRG